MPQAGTRLVTGGLPSPHVARGPARQFQRQSRRKLARPLLVWIATLVMLNGCGAGSSSERVPPALPTSTPAVAVPTADHSPQGYAMSGGVTMDQTSGSPAVLPWSEVPKRVGQVATISGHVKWCELGEGQPAVYAFDRRGTVVMMIESGARPAFTGGQLTDYCTDIVVTAPIVRRNDRTVILVTSPAQVTAHAPTSSAES